MARSTCKINWFALIKCHILQVYQYRRIFIIIYEADMFCCEKTSLQVTMMMTMLLCNIELLLIFN
jgi:hypothetical protein